MLSTIFVSAVIYMGSLQDSQLKEKSYWMIELNDVSEFMDSGSDVKSEIEGLIDLEDDNLTENLEEMPTPEQLRRFRKASIFNRLVDDVSTAESLYNETSPQGMAFNFITEHDQRNLDSENDSLIQRYALAVIYYATGGENWIYGNLHFLSGAHECQWHKKKHKTMLGIVSCNSRSQVTHIQLPSIELQGTIPSEIRVLERLEKLDLGNNLLTGTIPSVIGELSALTYLSLTSNILTGTIPEEISRMKHVEEILLQFNELEGSIPESICDLKEQKLYNFWTDCASSSPPLFCSCCSVCCDGFEACDAV